MLDGQKDFCHCNICTHVRLNGWLGLEGFTDCILLFFVGTITHWDMQLQFRRSSIMIRFQVVRGWNISVPQELYFGFFFSILVSHTLGVLVWRFLCGRVCSYCSCASFCDWFFCFCRCCGVLLFTLFLFHVCPSLCCTLHPLGVPPFPCLRCVGYRADFCQALFVRVPQP